MPIAGHYRGLAQLCRERAALRRHANDRDIMLAAAEEFEKLAQQAEGKDFVPPTRFDKD